MSVDKSQSAICLGSHYQCASEFRIAHPMSTMTNGAVAPVTTVKIIIRFA